MINPILDAKEAAAALVDAAFQRAVAAGELPDAPLPAYVVEIPADISHGDFAANAAMVGAQAYFEYQAGFLAGMSLNACAAMDIAQQPALQGL